MWDIRVQPRLMIPESVMKLMQAFVDQAPMEVNGFGLVRRDGETFYLDEVYILDQVVTPYSAETDSTALTVDDCRLADANLYELRRFQWHSHVDFAAFFSSTDVRNIHRWQGQWLISMVLNKQGHFEARLDLVTAGVRRQRPIEVTIVLEPDPGLQALASRQIADHVRVDHSPRGIAHQCWRWLQERF